MLVYSMARKAHTITLSETEEQKLELVASRPKSSQRDALRASIILECARGKTNKEIAELLGVSEPTVGKWRTRFAAEGIAALRRCAAQRAPEDDQRRESRGGSHQDAGGPPENRTHWSRRAMAKEMGIGQDSVGRIWRTFGVKPHVVRGFKLSKDPMFAEKVQGHRRALPQSRRTRRWCSRWMRRASARLWSVPSRCCR